MKNKTFYYLMAIIMLLTPSPKIAAIIVDKKEPNFKEVNKSVKIVIPRPPYNELDRNRIGRRIENLKTHKKIDVINSYKSYNGKVRSLGLVLHK